MFVAEELNNPAPETGDTTNTTPYVGLLVAAGVAVVGLGGFMFYKKKKDKEQE
ncbi:MAG: LPXTG cell wall anchor domain-containing protein [Firmicutes bacterium]|nr:LPXTG cell wall anchor domain-containing protein [Bacillota bacterium]